MVAVRKACLTVQAASSPSWFRPGLRLLFGGNGLTPSTVRPMSSGCLRRNMAERGTDKAMNTMAMTTKVVRQPTLLSKS